MGECGSKDHHHSESYMQGAHTHMCPKDPLFKVVCFVNKDWLLNSDGTPSEGLMHELAHVATADYLTDSKCLGKDNAHEWNIDDAKLWNGGHHELWASVMNAWGLEASLTCSAPY